ncbi:hypothetical protein [Vibrio sagamiensis]|uniref:Uncharacterized protein n=1 Tax=Vibrio sagamiensis NBRC 104589 TaxID=1219064 RepID=A0A511QB43_9VIBR|nr:hypothetical protein [Vibrio sagamiensis]GEM74531.1 hypothetical protein VSA01S_06430 [Vibrio sagamiensis NBRC 104589]
MGKFSRLKVFLLCILITKFAFSNPYPLKASYMDENYEVSYIVGVEFLFDEINSEQEILIEDWNRGLRWPYRTGQLPGEPPEVVNMEIDTPINIEVDWHYEPSINIVFECIDSINNQNVLLKAKKIDNLYDGELSLNYSFEDVYIKNCTDFRVMIRPSRGVRYYETGTIRVRFLAPF